MRCWRCRLPWVAFLIASSTGAAQTPDVTTYFPMEVGNSWTYFQILDPPDAPPDTLWRGEYVTSETISVNDTIYYRSDYPFALADKLRDDQSGRIWARIDGDDVLLFDFTLQDGETYAFNHPRETHLNTLVTMNRDLTVEVGAGRFESCVQLSFDDPDVLDDERAFAFAPGAGIVYAYGNGGDYEELYSAEVNGEVITAVEDAADASFRTEAPFAYPNPFVSSTTIILPNPTAPRAEARVYDLLGRAVAGLGDGRCHVRRCRFEWDGAGLSSGTYVVRMEGEGHASTLIVFLRR